MWPAVFSCGLGVHLCMCLEFYFAQHFWRLWFILFCGAFLSLPSLLSGSVSFLLLAGVSVSVGGLGLGLVLCVI